MIYHRMGQGDIRVSRIGLGTAQFGMDYGYHKALVQSEVDAVLEGCLRHGINFIDTAREYGNAEERIGAFLRENPQNDFVIATKISRILPTVADQKQRLKDWIKKSVDTSLQALSVDHIAVLQLHQCDEYVLNKQYFWESIEELKDQGLIAHFGVSIYEIAEAKRLIENYRQGLDMIQIPYNIFDQRFDAFLPQIAASGVEVMSRSVFLKGVIPVGNEKIPEEIKRIIPSKSKLNELAKKASMSSEEYALLFSVLNRWICSTVIGICSVPELELNMKVFEYLRKGTQWEADMRTLAVEDEFLIDPRRWASI